MNDYRGAIEDYNKAAALKPKSSATYSYRASAKDELADYHGAISDYNKAITLDPGLQIAYSNKKTPPALHLINNTIPVLISVLPLNQSRYSSTHT
jgi:tetratricopeptide (TPR) repeat protein